MGFTPFVVSLIPSISGAGCNAMVRIQVCTQSREYHGIHPNKVSEWSAFSLLPGSSCLERFSCFCPSFYLCQLFRIFLENLPLRKPFFFIRVHDALNLENICILRMCKCLGPAMRVRLPEHPFLLVYPEQN